MAYNQVTPRISGTQFHLPQASSTTLQNLKFLNYVFINYISLTLQKTILNMHIASEKLLSLLTILIFRPLNTIMKDLFVCVSKTTLNKLKKNPTTVKIWSLFSPSFSGKGTIKYPG